MAYAKCTCTEDEGAWKVVKEGHDDEDKPEEFDNTVEDEALLGLGDVKEVHGLNNSVVKSGNKVDFKEVYEDEDKQEEFNDTVEDEALLEIGNPPPSPMAGIRLPPVHALLLTRPSLLAPGSPCRVSGRPRCRRYALRAPSPP